MTYLHPASFPKLAYTHEGVFFDARNPLDCTSTDLSDSAVPNSREEVLWSVFCDAILARQG